jgi:hypothetical protein
VALVWICRCSFGELNWKGKEMIAVALLLRAWSTGNGRGSRIVLFRCHA